MKNGKGEFSLATGVATPQLSGDQLTARGKYVMSNQQKEIIDIGKFIALYRKENNKWHLQTDMFNTSMETRSPIEVPDYLSLPKN